MISILNYFHLAIDYSITALLISAIAYGLYAIATSKKNPVPFWTHLLRYVFTAYLIGVLLLTMVSHGSSVSRSNLIPFRGIFPALFSDAPNLRFQLIMNILLFLPFGLLFPAVFPKAGKSLIPVAVGFIFSLLIEIVQVAFLRGRCFDIDDVILNTTGSAVGYVIYTVLLRIRNRRKQ